MFLGRVCAECELLHQATGGDVGPGGRGAKLAVLLDHQERPDHRTAHHTGWEITRWGHTPKSLQKNIHCPACTLSILFYICLVLGPSVNYSGCQITWAKFCKVNHPQQHTRFKSPSCLLTASVSVVFLFFTGKHGRQRFFFLGVAGQHHWPGEEVHPGPVERRVRDEVLGFRTSWQDVGVIIHIPKANTPKFIHVRRRARE